MHPLDVCSYTAQLHWWITRLGCCFDTLEDMDGEED